MYKIYGSPQSSAGRCFWMLEELGVPYERVPIDMKSRQHKSPEYLKINPNGKIPSLVDGDFIIWESMAINTYLAAKHNSPLQGQNAKETGLIQQWSYWSILEVQKHAVEWLIQVMFVPTERKDPSIIEKAQKALTPLMTILNQSLENKKYLVGDRFTLGDLHVASTVNIIVGLGWSLKDTPNVSAWHKACHDRPAWHKVASLI
jgi:glutathione S-transferase